MSHQRPHIGRFGGLVGSSPEMATVFEMIQRAASVDVPVLIVGETGTGKELAAREIHMRSARQNGPFVGVNTGALSADLVASELFGHIKGAFTGAVDDHAGRFVEGEGGTLFLDEITTMSERVQVVFLRVLEEGVFRPVGGSQDMHSNVRVIAATNADLRQAVASAQFREDLLQRFTVFRIVLPPLREHVSDLPALAYHFLDQVAAEFSLDVREIAEEALDLLAGYPWPGNIRELKNAIAQAAIMAGQGTIHPSHIPPRIVAPTPTAPPPDTSADSPVVNRTERVDDQELFVAPMGLPLDELQKAYVLKTLARCSNNKTQAAKILGVSRKTLRDWLVRWGPTGQEQ